MLQGRSRLCRNFQQIWTNSELEGTESSHNCLKHASPRGNIFFLSCCIGSFCSHMTRHTIIETGCHRQHQKESIYITNFRLFYYIYFLCVPLSELVGSEMGKTSSDVFSFCSCFLWNPVSAASNSRRIDQDYSGRKPTNNPHRNNTDFRSFTICL